MCTPPIGPTSPLCRLTSPYFLQREKSLLPKILGQLEPWKLIVGKCVVTFLSVYAPQSGLSDEIKDQFFDQLRAVTARIQGSEFLIPCGDWNGHVGRVGTGYREVHGGMGYGRPEPDVEGERILEYALAFDLFLGTHVSRSMTAISPHTGRETQPCRLTSSFSAGPCADLSQM